MQVWPIKYKDDLADEIEQAGHAVMMKEKVR
jgi:hypothetical protein